MNIERIIKELSQKRPLFHNEADFQHALAWEIKESYPDAKIRLEMKVHGVGTKVYLDILAVIDGYKYAIELKYKTKQFDHMLEEEEFSLITQGAQDTGRYDVLKDLVRLEKMVSEGVADEGFLIFLTNDSSYYSINENVDAIDRKFRIHEGKEIHGTLSWGEQTGKGTMKGREEALSLKGNYTMNWHSYSQFPNRGGDFQYMIQKVSKDEKEWFNSFTHLEQVPTSQQDLTSKLTAHLESIGYSVDLNKQVGNEKVDLWAEKGLEVLAIEVRYKTAKLNTLHNDIHIDLKHQGAQDQGRYDYLRDLSKLEDITKDRRDVSAYALIITNDKLYWEKPVNTDTVDSDFRIHEGRTLTGDLAWKVEASTGTMVAREGVLSLGEEYQLEWVPFLILDDEKNSEFKALLVRV
ncbi:hypothetical protein N780_08530 [Pontibacillus chungwhensis BH030062]|uniref:Uncharacterized protein n=1 Tax=Pontibacillus chungwhensis BH030062 TaxID=1385513 RepID=A0A0A2UXK5_9BACI|nr:hypothetical protein [Pontibacillus chungwhensis]KGP91246.1 hypothetical protein N780_08530 [Pontibacillus chungwhensis BH030062]